MRGWLGVTCRVQNFMTMSEFGVTIVALYLWPQHGYGARAVSLDCRINDSLYHVESRFPCVQACFGLEEVYIAYMSDLFMNWQC